jgi:hypothetical protein
MHVSVLEHASFSWAISLLVRIDMSLLANRKFCATLVPEVAKNDELKLSIKRKD